MKINIGSIAFILFSLMIFPNLGNSQEDIESELKYDVSVNYPPLSITRDQMMNAKTLNDLNKFYKSEWVRTFHSVEVSTYHDGVTRKTLSKDDHLSQTQKENMATADAGSDIHVLVRYIPENTLKDNDSKEFKFTFMVNPDRDASFAAGQDELRKYLRRHAIDKIPHNSFKEYDLSVIAFTVNKKGEIVDPHLFSEESKDERIDAMLKEVVANMPNWVPAEYSNGTKIEQQLVLTVGNHESCVINMLNTKKYGVSKE